MPAEIPCFFDERPTSAAALSGRPVERPERARALGVQAVVPVTMVHQDRLLARWERLATGVPILPLWVGEPLSPPVAAR
jgi:hypothetical protein